MSINCIVEGMIKRCEDLSLRQQSAVELSLGEDVFLQQTTMRFKGGRVVTFWVSSRLICPSWRQERWWVEHPRLATAGTGRT